MKVVRGGRCAVKVNDTIGPYFPTYAGVRQGDPLSPILFDLVGDGLAMLIKKTSDRRFSERAGATFGGWRCVNSTVCR
jgi:hypothetical protein